jgi:nucleoside-diphosphate-sugar epimerase
LHEAGFHVLALSRNAPRVFVESVRGLYWQAPGPVLGESGEPGPFQEGAARQLVSCGPLELACALLERYETLERVVAFSTSSVLTKADSKDRAESLQMNTIREQEARLKALCGKRKIALLLLRPTMIYGCGLDRNVSLLARFGRRFGFIPLAGEAAGLRQPVHADDLAALVVHALGVTTAVHLESVACGGSTLTYREMAEKIAAVWGGKVRTQALPAWLLTAVVAVVSRLPAFRSLNTEMVRRQGVDMVFDDTALREALGYRPRAFEPRGGDFEIPAGAEEYQKRGLDV